jgi:hypothetical protein
VRICRKPPNRWGKYTCTNIHLTVKTLGASPCSSHTTTLNHELKGKNQELVRELLGVLVGLQYSFQKKGKKHLGIIISILRGRTTATTAMGRRSRRRRWARCRCCTGKVLHGLKLPCVLLCLLPHYLMALFFTFLFICKDKNSPLQLSSCPV